LLAEHPDASPAGAPQADNGAQQHRFARARTADHAEELTREDGQIQVFLHGLLAEAVDQPADLHQGFAFVAHQSISMKNRAASASSRMTTKMDCTTAEVVCSPTDSALPLTLKPSMQPMMAIRKANSGALAIRREKCRTATFRSRRWRSRVGEMSSAREQTTAPPSMPESMPMKVSAGRDMIMAMTRGITRICSGLSPRARMASISSFAFIEPIWAVKALAVRPAMRMAVSSTANSRRKEKATRSTV